MITVGFFVLEKLLGHSLSAKEKKLSSKNIRIIAFPAVTVLVSFFLKGKRNRLLYSYFSRYIFKIDLYVTFVAPEEDENTYINPSLRGDQPFLG